MIRKYINFLIYITITVCVVLCAGCADGLFGEDGTLHHTQRIELSGEIDQVAVTRVNDGGFATATEWASTLLTIRPTYPAHYNRAATVPIMYATLTMKQTVNGIQTKTFTGRTIIPI